MGGTNIGNQLIHWDYNKLLTSANFNKRFNKILPVGMYAGGLLTIVTGDVRVNPFVAEIGDGSYQVRVETQDNVLLSPTVTNSRIVVRHTYQESDNWYADILAIDPATTDPNDVIIGDVLFSGSLPSGFDYRNRTYPDFGLTAIEQETFTATENQTSFTLTGVYTAGTNTLWVFVNGVKQVVDVDFTEDTVNGKTVIFTAGLTASDVVEILIFKKER